MITGYGSLLYHHPENIRCCPLELCPISQVVRPEDSGFLLPLQAVLRQAMEVIRTTGARSTACLQASLPILAPRVGGRLTINMH